jgi:valyl-tRNA synthetase
MTENLPTKFNPQEVEAGRYQKWLDQDLFKPSEDKQAKPYSIVIPPPNVTGKLHLGHAWDTTLQDMIIRQNGCKALTPCGFLEWTMQGSLLKQK